MKIVEDDATATSDDYNDDVIEAVMFTSVISLSIHPSIFLLLSARLENLFKQILLHGRKYLKWA